MNNDKLDALFDGLTGTPQSVQQDEQPSKSKTTQKMAAKGQGRAFLYHCQFRNPQKDTLIAVREGLQIKDVVNAAFDKAVKSYERKNGTLDKDTRRDASQLF